jgi:hypothetical protein
MFPQQCFLVCPGLNHPAIQKHYWHSREAQIEPLLFECAFRIEALGAVHMSQDESCEKLFFLTIKKLFE